MRQVAIGTIFAVRLTDHAIRSKSGFVCEGASVLGSKRRRVFSKLDRLNPNLTQHTQNNAVKTSGVSLRRNLRPNDTGIPSRLSDQSCVAELDDELFDITFALA